MTTDTTPLQERIEHALWGFTQVYDAKDGRGTEVGVHAPVHKVLDAILPIVAGEVRKAKADAWDEGFEVGESNGYAIGRDINTDENTQNPYREQED